MFDCSPEAQARRRRQIDDIDAVLVRSFSSISDRSRSVGIDLPGLRAEKARLLREQAKCAGLRASRLNYVPLIKGL